ncbi:MAG: TlpA disulfide reductase family protein, partial [Polyangiales bacterium]
GGAASGPAPTTPGDSKAAPTTDGDAASEGANATDFTLVDVNGNPVSLSQYLGKGAVLIDFWATWCKPCMAELPHLQRMYDARRKDGFVVLAVSMDGPETEAEVVPTVRMLGYTFPVLLDPETRAKSLYNPRGAAPYSVLIDRHGRVFKRREGFNAGDERSLEADVDAAMK